MRRHALSTLALSLLSSAALTAAHAQSDDPDCLDGLCAGDGLSFEVEEVVVDDGVAVPQKDVTLYTSQEPINYIRRLRILGPQVAQVVDGGLVKPVSFYLDSNYMDFIDNWELEISRVSAGGIGSGAGNGTGEADAVVIKRLSSDQVKIGQPKLLS